MEEADSQGNVGLHLKSSEKRFWDLEQLGFYVEDVEATSWDAPKASVPLLVSGCLSCLRALCTPGHHGLVPSGQRRAAGVWPSLWSLPGEAAFSVFIHHIPVTFPPLPFPHAPAQTVGWPGALVGHGVGRLGAPSLSGHLCLYRWVVGGPAGVGEAGECAGKGVSRRSGLTQGLSLSLCLGLFPKQFKRPTHLPVCSWELPAQQHQPQPREARQQLPQGARAGPRRRGRRGSTKVGLPPDPPREGWEAHLPNLEARDRWEAPGEGTKWHSGPHPAGSQASSSSRGTCAGLWVRGRPSILPRREVQLSYGPRSPSPAQPESPLPPS